MLYLITVAAAIAALPATAAADVDGSDVNCVGMRCGTPVTSDYVPEAHGVVPMLPTIEDLFVESSSGFYDVPSIVGKSATRQGDTPPRTVVYLSKPGELDRMPASVRSLPALDGFDRPSDQRLDRATVIVIDSGLVRIIPSNEVAQAAGRSIVKRHRIARMANVYGCYTKYFCLYAEQNYGGYIDRWSGVTYAGTGWWDYYNGWQFTNFGRSMVNERAGDTLLADGWAGAGMRYCGQENSVDSTFSNNGWDPNYDWPSSVALLGSTPDRC